MNKKIKGKKEKKNKWQFHLLIIFILSMMTYGGYHSYKEKNELIEFPKYSIGIITKKYELRSRGYFIHYTYKVKNETFEGSQPLSVKENLVNIGDRFEVIYSPKTPEYSNLNFQKKINE